MVISHKYRFIFIKTYKTAGTSLEVYLSQHCGDDDVLTPIHPHVEPHRARNYQSRWNPLPEIIVNGGRRIPTTLRDLRAQRRFYNHIPARLVRARISRAIWNGYFKFCLERNPWDKVLSEYYMQSDRAGGQLSLDDFLQRRAFSVNYPLYTDRNGHLLVDQVLHYEDLNAELGRVFDRLGVPFDGSLGVKAKSEHRTDRRPYQQVYSAKQRDLIANAFAPELELHGYQF